MWQLTLAIGLVFAPIAAAMAFVITYEEWSHHQLPRTEVLKRSGEMAGATLLFFLLVCLVIGVTLPLVVGAR